MLLSRNFASLITKIVSGSSWTLLIKTEVHDDDDDGGGGDGRRQSRLERLSKLKDMPVHLQFNPYISGGYRPADLTTLECVKSIVYYHNETINILSHGLPLLYLALFAHTLVADERHWHHPLTYCHLVSCVSSWFGSFIYHVFMNHRAGERLYRRLLNLDMLGIWITQTFGALPTINASFLHLGAAVRYGFVAFYLMLSMNALYKGLTAHQAWQRPFSFALLVAMRVIAFTARMSTHHLFTFWSMHTVHVIMQELWPIIGALIAVFRVPERFSRCGRYDYCLNSHNIMHLLVLLGGLHMHFAFVADIEVIIGAFPSRLTLAAY